jgi:hypothetical protein
MELELDEVDPLVARNLKKLAGAISHNACVAKDEIDELKETLNLIALHNTANLYAVIACLDLPPEKYAKLLRIASKEIVEAAKSFNRKLTDLEFDMFSKQLVEKLRRELNEE